MLLLFLFWWYLIIPVSLLHSFLFLFLLLWRGNTVDLCSSSLILPSACSCLPLNLFAEFFSMVIVFFSFKISVWFFMFSISLLNFSFCYLFPPDIIIYLCSFVAHWPFVEQLFWILCQAIPVSLFLWVIYWRCITGGDTFLWFLPIPVALLLCLHILRSSYLFQML